MSCPLIWKEALSGKLTEISLQEYMKAGEDINGRATARHYTPLMAAVLKGHEKVVKVLLDNDANVNLRAEDDSTALWLATSTATRHSPSIVEHLLRKRPNLNAVPNKGSGNTPLMQAIVQLKNEKIISKLVDEGADVDIKNSQGKAAKELAAAQFNSKLLYALLPADQRSKRRASAFQNLRSFISHIIWVVNTVAGDGIGYLKQVLGITGRRAIEDPLINDLVPKELRVGSPAELRGASKSEATRSIADCVSVEEFEQNILGIADSMGLNRFFPRGSEKISKLAHGLVHFRTSNSKLNTVERLQGLATLSLYRTIILCDDSGSMAAPVTANSPIKRIDSQKRIVDRIADISSMLLPDDGGIFVRFLNKQVTWDKLGKDEVDQKMGTVEPDGGTPLGKAFEREVLKPFIIGNLETGRPLDCPYLICIVTDGAPNRGEDEVFLQELNKCMEMLEENGYGERVVSFIISRIGDDRSADKFIARLDDMNQFGDNVFICRDQIDEGIGGEGQGDADLELRLFDILTTPLMR